MDDAETLVAHVGTSGNLTLPAATRRRLGLEHGGAVVVSLDGEEIRIRSMTSAMHELRAKAGPLRRAAGDSVDRFLTERQAEDRSKPTHG